MVGSSFRGKSRVRRRLGQVVVVVALAVVASVGVPACSARASADSTDVLQEQFDALPPGGYLKLEPATYLHAGVLKIRVPGVRIDGDGATLQATNDATSAVQVEADGVQLSNINLVAPTDGERYSGLDQHKLLIRANGVSVTDISIVGSAASGIFVQGADAFRVDDVSITGTRADGVHITGGSSNGVVANVRTAQTGDDGVAVVSYDSDPAISSGIQISRVNVASTRWGRGISVVGGRNIGVRGFSVANTDAAGVYVATEGQPFFTKATDSVTISDGTVVHANTNPEVVQGAVLVVAGNPGAPVRDVQITGVSVSDTPASAQRDVGVIDNGAPVGAVSLNDISIAGSAVQPFYTNAPADSYRASGWVLDGTPIDVG